MIKSILLSPWAIGIVTTLVVGLMAKFIDEKKAFSAGRRYGRRLSSFMRDTILGPKAWEKIEAFFQRLFAAFVRGFMEGLDVDDKLDIQKASAKQPKQEEGGVTVQKNLLIVGFVLAALAGSAFAGPKFEGHLGDWTFKVPLASNLEAIGAYDVINKKGLVGGESVFVDYKKLEGTLGVFTDSDLTDGTLRGTLALGVRRQIPQWGIHIGIFIGRDFRENIYRAGIKGSWAIFGGSKTE